MDKDLKNEIHAWERAGFEDMIKFEKELDNNLMKQLIVSLEDIREGKVRRVK